ncbi:MAG: NADH-quinone oxidoreductase subunit M, partial [Deltaproteobacteria bacterium]|nr:NADH-quinone oxidoreductase subunit M [Deltaproteobacteria bacterium]
NLPEINRRELFTLVPLAIIVIAVGIYPRFVLDLQNISLTALNSALEAWKVAGL